MRLLRLKDDGQFSPVEYVGSNIPRYAILSHTWGADHEEVTFKDLTEGTGKSKAGYRKLTFCANQAAHDGLQYFWVDTCCIDKTSSAELSEAINSMYQWYKNAEVCYAYLTDVTTKSNIGKRFETEFANSKWFTRGWTLQELIAPPVVIFFGASWNCLGNRSDFKTSIKKITNIEDSVLAAGDPSKVSVAQRMSWASRRKTTRVEDMAYSLMGLFNVHMPPLYGEGKHAFIRLQEEIIKTVDDQTIFAWKDACATSWTYVGLLARSPANFDHCGNLLSHHSPTYSSKPFAMTNRGLSINLHCVSVISHLECREYWAQLECTRRPLLASSVDEKKIYIKVHRLSENADEFVRVEPHKVFEDPILPQEPRSESTELLYFRHNIMIPEHHRTNRVRGFLLKSCSWRTIPITTVWTNHNWIADSNLIEFSNESGTQDIISPISTRILFRSGGLSSYKGIELEYNPWSDAILNTRRGNPLKPTDFCGYVYKFGREYQPHEESFNFSNLSDSDEILKSMEVVLVEDTLYIQVLLDTKDLHLDLIEY
jgi:hypothetical protein